MEKITKDSLYKYEQLPQKYQVSTIRLPETGAEIGKVIATKQAIIFQPCVTIREYSSTSYEDNLDTVFTYNGKLYELIAERDGDKVVTTIHNHRKVIIGQNATKTHWWAVTGEGLLITDKDSNIVSLVARRYTEPKHALTGLKVRCV